MNTGVRASISKGFPEREIATTNEQSGTEQPGNQVVAVRFRDGERVFLKIATDGNHQRITRDAAAIRYAGTHCDVRVPQVLVADPTADPPYVATTLLHGTPVSAHWNLFETDEREAILRQVGRGLAGIHTAQFGQSGHIVGGGADELDLDAGTWTDILCDDLERRTIEYLPDRFKDIFNQVCQSLHEHRSHLDNTSSVLLHGDPHPENCFFNSQIGFVDWETALVGDPTLDLCYVENQYIERPSVTTTDQLYRALRSGYCESVGGLPSDFELNRRIYRVVTFLLLQIATFDYWAPQAEDSAEELAGWVREEITRRINCLYE